MLSIRIRNELGPADPDPHSGFQKKGRKKEEIFTFLRLECSLLRSAGFSWRPQRKSEEKTFDRIENFWRKPGPEPAGESLDPD